MSEQRRPDGTAGDDDGGSGGGDRLGSEDRTVVVVVIPRITRGDISQGLRNLAAGAGGLRAKLYETAGLVDDGTAAGLDSLTLQEKEEIEADIEDVQTMLSGFVAALDRAVEAALTATPT